MKLLSPLSNPSRLLIGFFAASSLSFALPIIFDRGLPTSGYNDPTSSARSNVNWGNGGGFLNGDSFTLGVSSLGAWFVDTISVWTVLNATGNVPSDEFSSFTLYGGPSGNPSLFAPINIGQPTVALDRYTAGGGSGGICDVGGGGGDDYLSQVSPTCLPIYKLTFTVDLILGSGAVFDFAADGVGGTFFSHATNAALAGIAQPGSDDLYLNWDATFLAGGAFALNSDPLCGTGGSHGPDSVPSGFCGGWDKPSDINVQVTGAEATPEPSTISMLGLGLVAVIAGMRRRRRC